MIVYGLSAIMLLVVCLVTTPLAGTFVFFLFCLEFPDYSVPCPVLYLFLGLPGYHIFLCSLPIVVKIYKKKIVAYWFIFDFLASPADELWH